MIIVNKCYSACSENIVNIIKPVLSLRSLVDSENFIFNPCEGDEHLAGCHKFTENKLISYLKKTKLIAI